MKSFFSVLLATATTFCFAQTGIGNPEMATTDSLVNKFLADYDIPGATMALAKDGKIVYMRAFGYSDLKRTVPTQPYNLFRIASLSKQITSVAIMKMMEDSLLTMNEKVFGPAGILENHPAFSEANITDKRIYDITVQQLLEHSAGWDRDTKCNPNPTIPYNSFFVNCDPISVPLRVAMLTKTSNPVSKNAMIKYSLEKGLDFTPGTKYHYSNIGYLVLGKIIEEISGLTYEQYVQKNILAPLGIFDMHLAKNLLIDKQEREVEYTGNGFHTLSCYNTGSMVPWEYGGFNMEAMDAYAGWITTARDMMKLLVAVDGFRTKPDILKPATLATMVTPSSTNTFYAKGWFINADNNWWHTGSIDGTACEMVRASNGFSWIIVLNKRVLNNNNFWNELDNLGWSCLSATKNWPAYDLMNSPTVNASDITFTNKTASAVTLSWINGNGNNHMLLVKADSAINSFPLDGTDYRASAVFGAAALNNSTNYVVYNGTGNTVTITGLTPGKNYYYRLVEYNANVSTGNNALYLLGNNPVASTQQPAIFHCAANRKNATMKRKHAKILNAAKSLVMNTKKFFKSGNLAKK